MLIRCLKECAEFIGGDDSILRELLHPDKMDVQIRYSLAHAKVPAGKKTRRHKLRTAEVYYILAGKGLMHVDKESVEVSEHCAVYIPPNAAQYIENTADCELEFLCIVDPAWRQTDETVLQCEKVNFAVNQSGNRRK